MISTRLITQLSILSRQLILVSSLNTFLFKVVHFRVFLLVYREFFFSQFILLHYPYYFWHDPMFSCLDISSFIDFLSTLILYQEHILFHGFIKHLETKTHKFSSSVLTSLLNTKLTCVLKLNSISWSEI